MLEWKRCRRISASLRRWMNLLHAIFQRWYRSCIRRLFGRERLDLERFEDRTVAGTVVPVIALLGSAAIVRTAEPPASNVSEENLAADRDDSQEDICPEDSELSDRVFSSPLAKVGDFSEVSRLPAKFDAFLSLVDAQQSHSVNDKLLDPVMATENALFDPLSNPGGDAKP